MNNAYLNKCFGRFYPLVITTLLLSACGLKSENENAEATDTRVDKKEATIKETRIRETRIRETRIAEDKTLAESVKKSVSAPPFSAAMKNLKPLGTVTGDFRSLLTIGSNSFNGDFTAAVDYAVAMDSYSLLIWHKGALLLEKYFGDFDASLRPETASMHKSVMALLVAAAIEDGFIQSVDDPVGDYIEQWQKRPEGKITIANLLTMSSGLKPLSSAGGADSPRKLTKNCLNHIVKLCF